MATQASNGNSRRIEGGEFLTTPRTPRPPGFPRGGEGHVDHDLHRLPSFATGPVVLAGGAQRDVSKVRVGDRIAGAFGREAEVLCVVRTEVAEGKACGFVHLPGGVVVSPCQPLRWRTRPGSEWHRPSDLLPAAGTGDGQSWSSQGEVPHHAHVYSFVLRGAPSLYVGGFECLALGHGLSGPFVDHPYLAGERVVEDLWKMDGWYEGIVDLPPGRWARRDVLTGHVCELTQGGGPGRAGGGSPSPSPSAPSPRLWMWEAAAAAAGRGSSPLAGLPPLERAPGYGRGGTWPSTPPPGGKPLLGRARAGRPRNTKSPVSVLDFEFS
mmetsp:Transcript_17391/g.55861  ORF Transcript_17391/g.55861 Transcript_17391/m.55861 type:complete len:324 (-) Transcript_17391:31-1002(-)